ncbi:hypothetical protein DPMN_147132 [Dreissena polymorpha]|uniref:Uncharacterized protein n=1 Tax=Dreissena polymorpha TaxID=45954 RepID=A0A9D4F9Z2_DREPO|nr:hypothetical protein DPMN_147132 [Dreissena polymorpha]
MDRLHQTCSLQSPLQDEPSPVVKPSSDRGPHHGQAAQPVLCESPTQSLFQDGPPRW